MQNMVYDTNDFAVFFINTGNTLCQYARQFIVDCAKDCSHIVECEVLIAVCTNNDNFIPPFLLREYL